MRGERIARALELFWDGEYDASAHVLVPRLESILRDIARHSDVTIAKLAREGKFGGVVSLNIVGRVQWRGRPGGAADHREASRPDWGWTRRSA